MFDGGASGSASSLSINWLFSFTDLLQILVNLLVVNAFLTSFGCLR